MYTKFQHHTKGQPESLYGSERYGESSTMRLSLQNVSGLQMKPGTDNKMHEMVNFSLKLHFR